MSPIYVPGKVVLSRIQQYPAVLGEPWGGGYFAGYISHTADGNPTHALIVAPRATGATGTGYTLTTNLAWKTANTTTAGTTSPFDGAANTAAMVTAGIADHPAAEFCKNLTIGSFTDWYLPARYENEIAYFNLKPTTELNNFSGAEVGTRGLNPYAVPARAATYTTAYPAQTYVTSFNSSAERFEANHWSSTESVATTAWRIAFANGREDNSIGSTKTTAYSVRAFRRIAL